MLQLTLVEDMGVAAGILVILALLALGLVFILRPMTIKLILRDERKRFTKHNHNDEDRRDDG